MACRRAALAVLLAAPLAACPRAPLNLGKDGAPRDAEDALRRVDVAEAQVQSLESDAKLFVDAPQGKGSTALFVAVRAPAQLHLEQLDFFNRPQSVLVADAERFGLYDAQAGKYYRGPASAENLARALPLVMSPAELTALLLGRVPRMAYERAELRLDEGQGAFVVTLTRGAARQTLWVQPPHYRVVKSQVEGLAAYDVEVHGVEETAGVAFPKRLTLRAAQAKTTLELTFRSPELNKQSDAALFEVAPPEDVPVVELDARGAARE